MLDMTLTCLELDDLLIVGAHMRYRGIDHLKRYVGGKGTRLWPAVEEGLTVFLKGLKRPCRIDLRTDQLWLVESRWNIVERNAELAAAVSRHQINWTLLLTGCQTILDVQKSLAGDIALFRKVVEIFHHPGSESQPVKDNLAGRADAAPD